MIRSLIFFVAFLLLPSCDFTTKLHKDILIAQEYVASKNYQKAVSQYEAILGNNPPKLMKVKIKYQLGELYLIHLGDSQKALSYFKKIKEKTVDPLWLVKAEEKIGDINFSFLKKFPKSVSNYKKLSEFTPKLKKLDFYEYRLAFSYWNINNKDKALEVFKKIKSNPSHEYYKNSYYHIGMIYFEKKLWKKAIEHWNDYLKLESRKDNIIQTKFLMANAFEMTEELKLAYNLYYSILGEYPNTKVIQNRLNSIYERRIARKR